MQDILQLGGMKGRIGRFIRDIEGPSSRASLVIVRTRTASNHLVTLESDSAHVLHVRWKTLSVVPEYLRKHPVPV